MRRWGLNGYICHTRGGVFTETMSKDQSFIVTDTATLPIINDQWISFSAKNGSAIFSGSKLQPQALQVLACIRT